MCATVTVTLHVFCDRVRSSQNVTKPHKDKGKKWGGECVLPECKGACGQQLVGGGALHDNQGPPPPPRPLQSPPPTRETVTWPKKHRKHEAPKAPKKFSSGHTRILGGGDRHLVTVSPCRAPGGRDCKGGVNLLNRHQVGGVSRSPDGLFAQQEREPIRGRPAVRGKSTYGEWPGQRVEEQGTWASQKHSEAGYGRPVDRGTQTAKTVKRPRQQPAHPQYTNYWVPLTRKRHTMPHSAQPQHTNYWAPRTQKRQHRPQRLTERSDPTQHAKGRTGDCPGPRKGATTRRNVTWGSRAP